MDGRSKVALVREATRYETVSSALEAGAGEFDWGKCNVVLVKPNFVSTTNQAASTHVDAVRAVVDFVRGKSDVPIVIAEGAALSNTWEGFLNFGYLELHEEYHNLTFLDLNDDEAVGLQVYTRDFRPQTLEVARTVLDSNCVVSVGPPKTHDTVIVTLSLKNIVMGSIINRGTVRMPINRRRSALIEKVKDRAKRFRWVSKARAAVVNSGIVNLFGSGHKVLMHQGYPAMNLNLFAMAFQGLKPDLSVIDGWVGMEGAGPTDGEIVPWRMAVVSSDFLAADSLTAWMMGYPPDDIGYLHYCIEAGLGRSRMEEIEIVGNLSPEKAKRPFRPHPTYRQQIRWRDERAEAIFKELVRSRPAQQDG